MKAHIKLSLLLSFLLFLLLVCCPQSQINAKGFLKDILSSSAINKGKEYKSNGDYISAIKEFTKSIKREPENLEAYYQLGLIFEDVMLDYDKAISLYKNIGNHSKGLKPTGTEEEVNAFNLLITNAKTSIDRAIKKKFDSIEKPKIPIYIMVKPYKKILSKPEMFATSKYKTTSYASEFKLLNFKGNWYQVNVRSIGSGWINGTNVLKIIQKEKEAIETSPAGKAALYERFKDLYPDFRFAADAKDKADSISYNLAKADDTINSYSTYLKNHPNGKYSEEAKTKIDKYTFEDESFINNLDRLKDWVRKNPENSFLEKAKVRIDELAFAQAILDNNTKSLESYITENPRGKYVSEARQIINGLKRDRSKPKSTEENTIPNPVITNGILGWFRHGTFPSPPLGEFTHVGVDLVAPCGSDIYAFADGRVKDVIDNTNDKNYEALGYMVLIEHPASLIGKKFYTLYLHMKDPPEVKIGNQVNGGSTVIGKIGDSGKTLGGCHTHFEIRYFPERFSTWGNIYGPGDQRASDYFKQNWGNPLTFFKKHPNGIKLAKSSEGENNTVKVEKKKDSSLSKMENNTRKSHRTQIEDNKKSNTIKSDLSSVYSTKNSRTYHKRNCSELNTADLIEFDSPQKADSAGAIPCNRCNPSDIVLVDKKNKEKHNSGTTSDTQIETDPNEGVYSSDLKGGKKHDQKTLTFSDGSKYVGGVKDDKMHGQGTLTWPSGSKYVGEFKDGKAHGQGTKIWHNGDKHVGEFRDGNSQGHGTYTWSNGVKYVGEFKDTKMHGQGTKIWPNGDKYAGEWKDGKMHGQGTSIWSSGNKYVGMCKNDKKHGHGTFTWPSGNKYVGEYKDGVRHGQGTFTWSSGNKYVGGWKDGNEHGHGTYAYADGEKYVGEWKNGERYDSSLDNFISKNGVKAWPSLDNLAANPFVYEGKIVGIKVSFAKMQSATIGLFEGDGFFSVIMVSDIPKGLFTASVTRVIIAGKVLGNKKLVLPILGASQVPHLKFIDYMLPNK